MEFYVKINADFPNYEVSNLCNVRNTKTGKFLKKYIGKNGYAYHTFSRGKYKKKKYLHRLMAEAFIENPLNKNEVNHINGQKLDNTLENLEWLTRRENQLHYFSKKNKTSQYLGVSFFKLNSKWRAYIRINRKLIILGYYKTEIEAYNSRVNFEKQCQIDSKYL
jgi:hypothetical protein